MKSNGISQTIRQELSALKNDKNADFLFRLIPDGDRSRIIGAYSKDLKAVAKKYASNQNIDEFLSDLPHYYHEENVVHALIVCAVKDYDECLRRIEGFLPFVNNWAVCDCMRPKIIKTRLQTAKKDVERFIASDHTYTARFGIEMVMTYYLGENFDSELFDLCVYKQTSEYYVKMMMAWLIATAAYKNPEGINEVLKGDRLDAEVKKMAVRKIKDSRRVSL